MRTLFGGAIAVVSVLVIASGMVAAQGTAIDKAYMGTWKLNVAKSKYVSGAPPRETTRRHDDRGDGFVIVWIDTVSATGEKSSNAYTYKPDGKPYPTAQLNAKSLRTIALKAIDPYTVTWEFVTDGKVTGRGRRTLSKDGRSMVLEGIDEHGKVIGNVDYYEKQ